MHSLLHLTSGPDFRLPVPTSVTRRKSSNVYKSWPKMISLEQWLILTPLQNLPRNVGDLGILIYAKGFKKLPKVQKITKSGHTGTYLPLYYLYPTTLTNEGTEIWKLVEMILWTTLRTNISWLQRASNSYRQRRRHACWPLIWWTIDSNYEITNLERFITFQMNEVQLVA